MPERVARLVQQVLRSGCAIQQDGANSQQGNREGDVASGPSRAQASATSSNG